MKTNVDTPIDALIDIPIDTHNMPPCSAILSTHQRRILRTSMTQEYQIMVQCNKIMHQLSELLNELQCINHVHELDERTLKCDKFIRTNASISCDMSNYDMVTGAVQMAMTCDCVCIQATCFRMLYKWMPKLDILRMKMLKIKKMCSETGRGSTSGIETCARIEKTVHKILKLKPASH